MAGCHRRAGWILNHSNMPPLTTLGGTEMTATTEETRHTLLRYEQGRRPYPWSRRNRIVPIQSDSERLSRTITDSLQHTCRRMSFDQSDLPSPPGSADLILPAPSGPSDYPGVALTRTHIVRQAGKTPIVMLPQQQFDPRAFRRLHHLSLRIEPAAPCHQVRALLG